MYTNGLKMSWEMFKGKILTFKTNHITRNHLETGLYKVDVFAKTFNYPPTETKIFIG